MRVPDVKYFDILLKYDRERSSILTRKTEELSSGKKLLYPSDNPVDFARAARFKNLISQFERFNRNIDLSKSSLESAETALANVVNAAQEVRVKFIQVLNTGVINQEEAESIVNYFQSMRDYIIQQGNLKVGDSYIFGGVKTQDAPFDSNGTYSGETKVTTIPVANGVEVNTNFNGAETFGVNLSSNKILLVEVIDEVINLIESGNLDALHTQEIAVDLGSGVQNMKLLDAFDAGLSKVMEYRSILGTQVATVENLQFQNDNLRLHYSDLVSKLEDADYAAAIAEYEKAQTAYTALMLAIQQTKDLSLLNFMR